MDKQEFLLLIPAIVYGVAIVDLLKIFSHRNNYFEMVGWGLFTMTAVIFSWIELYNKLDAVTSSNVSFFLIIGQSILVAQIASIITPEENDKNTKEYFLNNRKTFFLLLVVSTILSYILQLTIYNDDTPPWFRLLAISLYLTCAFAKERWLRVAVLAVVMILAILRVFTDVIV